MRQSGNTISMLIRQYRAVLRHSFWMNAVLNNPVWRRSLLATGKSALAGAALTAASVALAAETFTPPASTSVLAGSTKTKVDPSGNVYKVTTSLVTGSNAINSFTRFDVAQGDIVKLMLPSGTQNLINLVNDTKRSDIYGTVNSLINDTTIGGHVYFLNPKGVVIGAKGVFNVGSLTIQTPTQATLDNFLTYPGLIDSNCDAVIKGQVPIGKEGVITVQGRINALDLVKLQARRVELSADSLICAGPTSQAAFSKITNVSNLIAGNALSTEGGTIRIIATSTTSDAAEVVMDKATLRADKAISVEANATSTNVFAGNASASVVIKGNSLLQSGGSLNVSAASSVASKVEAKGKDDLSDDESAATATGGSEIYNWMGNNLIPIANVHMQEATSTLSIEDGSKLTAAGALTVSSSASFDVAFTVYGYAAGFAYGDGSAKSTLTLNGQLKGATIDVLSETKGKMEVTTSNTAQRMIGSDCTVFDAMIALASTSYTNTLTVGKTATLEATQKGTRTANGAEIAELTVAAKTETEEGVEVEAGGYQDDVAVALGVSLRDADTALKMEGKLTAEDISVEAEFKGEDDLGVDSFQGAHFLSPIGDWLKKNAGVEAKVHDLAGKQADAAAEAAAHSVETSASGKTPSAFTEFMKGLQEKIGACGAVAIHKVDTNTVVSVSGTINASKDVEISAKTADENIRSNVGADVGEEKKIGLGVAVLVDNRQNLVDTVITSTAVIEAGEKISITADYEQPYHWSWLDKFTDIGKAETVGEGAKTLFTETLPDLLSCDFGLSAGTFSSGARTAAEGESFAAAASVNISIQNNQATTRVADGAHLAVEEATGSVNIASSVDVQAVNFCGNVGVPLATIKPTDFNFGFWYHGTESEGAGIGLSYMGLFNTSSAMTLVGNATITTGSLSVAAENKGLGVDVGLAGGKATSFGMDGVVTTNMYKNSTIALISEGAQINAKGAVSVEAVDDFTLVAPQGGIVAGASAGVGFSVGYSQMTRHTVANVGYLTGTALADVKSVITPLDSSWRIPSAAGASTTTMKVAGGLKVSAENKGIFVNAALAGAATKTSKEHGTSTAASVSAASAVPPGAPPAVTTGEAVSSDPITFDIPTAEVNTGSEHANEPVAKEVETAAHDAKAKMGAGISGDAAVCVFDATTEAVVRGNLNIDAGTSTVAVEAVNDDTVVTVGGGMTIATNDTATGIAGSVAYSQNTLNTTASLAITGKTTAGEVEVSAERKGMIVTAAASLNASTSDQKVGIAASGAFNYVTGTTEASIKNGKVHAEELVSVIATDNSTIVAASGALTAGNSKVGVGGAFSWNKTESATNALIDQANRIDAGTLSLMANNYSVVYAPSAAGGIAFGSNTGGLAGSFSVNIIKDTAKAMITGTSTGTIINTGKLLVMSIDGSDGSKGNSSLWTLSGEAKETYDAGLKKVDTDSQHVTDGKGNTTVTYNENPDRAKNEAAENQTYAFQNTTPAASDKIIAVNLGVGVGAATGSSFAGSYNQIDGGATASLANNVTLNVSGDRAVVQALNSGNILAIGAAPNGGAKSSGGVCIGINLINTDTKTELLNNTSVNLTGSGNHQFAAFASNSCNLTAIDVVGGGSAKASGAATVAYNQFKGDSLVTMTNSSLSANPVSANQLVDASFSAFNSGNITSVSVGGSGAGSLAGAASVGINRLGGDTLISLTDSTVALNGLAGDSLDNTKNLTFDTEATRNILAVCVGGAASGGYAGAAAVSYNQLGGQNGMLLKNSQLLSSIGPDSTRKTSFNVTDAMVGQSVVVGGSGAGTAAVAASVAINTVGDSSMSPDTAAREQQLSDAFAAGDSQAFNSHLVGVQASDSKIYGTTAVNVSGKNSWVTVAVGGAGSGTVAIGLAGAYNNIGGDQLVSFTNSKFNSLRDLAISNTQKDKTIAVGAAGSGSGAVAIGTTVLINNFYANTAVTLDQSTLKAAGDIPIKASSSIDAVAVSVGGAGSGVVAIGASGMANKLTNTVSVDVNRGSSLTSTGTGKSILISAAQDNKITSVAVSGSGAGTCAVAGAVGVNLSKSTTHVGVDRSTLTADGSVALNSAVTEDILSIGLSGTGAGVMAMAGTVNTNVLNLTNEVLVSNSQIDAQGNGTAPTGSANSTGITVSATTNESSEIITMDGGGAGIGSIQAAFGVNQIASTTTTSLTGSTLTTHTPAADIVVSSSDSTNASNYAVSASGAGAIGLGAGEAITTFDSKASTLLNNSHLTSSRDVLLSAFRSQKGYSIAIGAGGAIAGVGGSVGYAYYGGASLLSLDRSSINATRNSTLSAKAIIDVDGYIGSGAGGVAGLAAGVQIISVLGTTAVNITNASAVSAGHDISLDSNSTTTVDTVVASAAGGAFAANGAVNTLGLTDSTSLKTDANASLTASNALTVSASSDLTVQDVVGGAQGGSMAIGASVDVITVQSSAFLQSLAKTDVGGNATFTATNSRDVRSDVVSGTVGGLAAGGAVIVAKFGPNQTVTAAPDISGYANANKLLTKPTSDTNAVLSSIKDKQLAGLDKDGALTKDEASSVSRNINSNWSAYTSTQASSAVTTGTITAKGSVSINANTDTTFKLLPVFASAGGVSTGATVAYAQTTDITSITSQGNIKAAGIALLSSNTASSSYTLGAGTMGGLSIPAGYGKIIDNAATSVTVAPNVILNSTSGTLSLKASSSQHVKDKADLVAIGSIGGEGAGLYNYSNRLTTVAVSNAASLSGNAIEVDATNVYGQNKVYDTPKDADANSLLPGVGGVAVVLGFSDTRLNNKAQVLVDNQAKMNAATTLALHATNVLASFDFLHVIGGGGIAVVSPKNTLELTFNSSINLGAGTSLLSDGDMTLAANSNGSAYVKAIADCGALGGGANAIAKIQGNITNSVAVGQNSTLQSNGSTLSLLAGATADGKDDALTLTTEARSYAYGVAVVPLTTASTSVEQQNSILVDTGASVLSTGDINLLAGTKGPKTASYYSAKWNGIGGNKQSATLDDSGGIIGVTVASNLTVNGSVQSGIHDQRFLYIDASNKVSFVDPDNSTQKSQDWAAPSYHYDANVSMALELQNRIAQLNASIAAYAGNADVVARYQADLDSAKSLLAAYGNKTSAQYTIAPFTLSLHNVKLGGSQLLGTGSIGASQGSKVSIVNDSTAVLKIAAATDGTGTGIKIDDTKGYVTFNTIPVSSVKGFKGSITGIQNGVAPTIRLENRDASTRPMLEVDGNVTNTHGAITLTSTGTAFVNGASLQGKSVSITAGGDYIQTYTPGFKNLGGEPASNASGGSIISAGSVFIAAEKLNVNGTIQSGIDSVTIDITDADLAAAKNLTGDGFKQVRKIQVGEAFVASLNYNPGTGAFSISDVTLGGGYVELFGNIFSTGNGNIRVLDGSGTISVNNTTGHALELGTLDAGNAKGIVRITDTSKTHVVTHDNTKVTLYETTEFIRSNGNVTRTSYVLDGSNKTILSSSVSSVYQPTEKRQLRWVNATDYKKTELHQEASKGSETWTKPVETSQLSYSPLIDGGYWLEDENTKQAQSWTELGARMHEVKGKVETDKVDGKKVQRWNTTYTQTTYSHEKRLASNPISINFFGNTTGSVSVATNSNLLLNGSVNGRGGSVTVTANDFTQKAGTALSGSLVTLTAKVGSIGTATNPLIVNATKSVTATSNMSIGLSSTMGDLPINMLRAPGTVSLNSVGSIIGVNSAPSTYTETVRPASGSSFVMTLDQKPHIIASEVNLNAFGSISGDSSGSLSLYNFGGTDSNTLKLTATAGNGDILLSVPTGTSNRTATPTVVPLNLSVNQIIALNGNVTLNAPGANVLDGNDVKTVDPLTPQEQATMWGNAGLTSTPTGDDLANRTKAYANAKTQEYHKVWEAVKYSRANYDPNYVFTFSDNERSALLAQGFSADTLKAEEGRITQYYKDTLSPASATYDAKYLYVLTDADRTALSTPKWNTKDLANSAPMNAASTLGVTAGHGIGVHEENNVMGKIITIKAMDIGTDLGEVLIPASLQWSAMSEAQQLAIRTASSGDIKTKVINGVTTLSIDHGEDLDIAASSYAKIDATGSARLFSDTTLVCRDLNVAKRAIVTSNNNLDIDEGTLSGLVSLYAWNTLYINTNIHFGQGSLIAEAGGSISPYPTKEDVATSPLFEATSLNIGTSALASTTTTVHKTTHTTPGLSNHTKKVVEKIRQGLSMEQLAFLFKHFNALSGLEFHMAAKPTPADEPPPELEQKEERPVIIDKQVTW